MIACLTLGASVFAASAGARVVVDPATHHRFGIVPTLQPGLNAGTAPLSHAAAPASGSCTTDCSLMTYHTIGAPVQHAEHDYLLFWAPSGYANPFPPTYVTGMQTFMNDLAAAAYTAVNPVSVNQEYYDCTGACTTKNFVPYAVQNAGTLTDTDPYPASGCPASGFNACLTDAQIQQEVASYVAANHLPTGIDTQYYVMTPQNVRSCFDAGGSSCSYTAYCGYHNFFSSNGQTIVYADMPWAYNVNGCDVNTAFGTGYANTNFIDPVVGVFSHELSETMTDPQLNAWYDSSGNEIGDKCAYTYGSGGYGSVSGLHQDGNGGYYNLQGNSGAFYLLQLEFDNRSADCQLTDNDPQPTGSISAPAPVVLGQQTTLTANVTTGSGIGVAYVNWDYGDGSTSTGTSTSADHTFTSRGPVTVTAIVTDTHGNEVRLTHDFTVESIPVNTARPTVSGTAAETHALTEAQGTWTNSPSGYTYGWERCDTSGANCAPISGATGQSYTLTSADAGSTIRAVETATGIDGNSDPAPSDPTAVVIGLPSNTALPTVSGAATQGQTLTESNGGWTNSPSGFSYQWQACDSSGANCSAIAGATGQTYTLTGGEVGHTIRVQETASNLAGPATASSSATSAVIPLPPSNTAPPTITGVPLQDQTLTEAHGSWTNGPTSYSYQWERCLADGTSCAPIAGATGDTYRLTSGDVGSAVRVLELAGNAGGSAATSAPSDATSPITPLPPGGSGHPGISGAATEGTTLTDVHASWTNNPTSFTYQWQRCDTSGAACAAIGGATGQTYRLSAADIGHTIRVLETAANAGGAGSALASAPSARVQPSAAHVSAVLATVVAPRSKKIPRLLSAGGYKPSFGAPSGGVLVISWRAGKVLVASARIAVPGAGPAKGVLRLTPAGRSLLKRSKSLKIVSTATFTPAGGRAISVVKKLSLTR